MLYIGAIAYKIMFKYFLQETLQFCSRKKINAKQAFVYNFLRALQPTIILFVFAHLLQIPTNFGEVKDTTYGANEHRGGGTFIFIYV